MNTENSEKKKNIKVSAKRLFVVTILMVVTAAAVALGTWTFVNLGEDNIAETNEAHIGLLEDQLLKLSVAVKTQETLAKNNVALGTSSTAKQ